MVIGALRGLATAGIGPAELPDRLAGLLRSTALPPVRGGVYCGYRPGTRTLTWAHGDGPAPLLFRDGTGRGQAGQAETTLEAGDLLLLHTGGLVPAGRQRLLALTPRLTGARSAQEVLRIVAAEIGEPLRREDACVLVARVTPQ
jgi:hypothetical protein